MGIKSGKRRGARANGIPLARSGKLQPPAQSAPTPRHPHLHTLGGTWNSLEDAPQPAPGGPARPQGCREAQKRAG